eukprot:scaffold22190_cov24-Attheya_sp.AAC.1
MNQNYQVYASNGRNLKRKPQTLRHPHIYPKCHDTATRNSSRAQYPPRSYPSTVQTDPSQRPFAPGKTIPPEYFIPLRTQNSHRGEQP